MTSDAFVYWLKGYSELTQSCPTQFQWIIIQDHLNLVFKKITPYRVANDITGIDFSVSTPTAGAQYVSC